MLIKHGQQSSLLYYFMLFWTWGMKSYEKEPDGVYLCFYSDSLELKKIKLYFLHAR